MKTFGIVCVLFFFAGVALLWPAPREHKPVQACPCECCVDCKCTDCDCFNVCRCAPNKCNRPNN